MKRIIASIILAFTLLIGQAGIASAQETIPSSGTVQTIELDTDATTNITTVLVTYTYTDGTGAQQTATARLSLETAANLGLVIIDPATQTATKNEAAIGTLITIPTETAEEEQHPVGAALADFFSDLVGVDYDTIMDYHENGTGFGVIVKALWLTSELDGDTATFTALLDAKKSGDYSGITLVDGSTPRNWGDVVKSLKKGENLGAVKSGRANDQTATDKPADHGRGNGKANGSNNGKGGGKNKP